MLESAAGVVMDVAMVAKMATERAPSMGEVEGAVGLASPARRSGEKSHSRRFEQVTDAPTTSITSVTSVRRGGDGSTGSTFSFDEENAANVREEDALSGVKGELLAQVTDGFSWADITKI
mmetsp:Transcript_7799/g.16891  ORF Transcript_7799/g.16891 Transcript_7799/m.16891 type:complete len:120 (-) Transcript_7799:88-447(-)